MYLWQTNCQQSSKYVQIFTIFVTLDKLEQKLYIN